MKRQKRSITAALPAVLTALFLTQVPCSAPADARGEIRNTTHPVPVSEAVVNGQRYLVCKTVVSADPDRVWRVISDYNNLHRVFPQMKKCKLLKSNGNTKVMTHVVRPSGPVGTYSYTVKVREQAPRKMEWNRLKGAFKEVKGFFKLEPLDNGRTTLVTYASHVEGGFLLPQPLVRRQCRIDMPQVMKSLKKTVESRIRIAGKPVH